MKKVIDNFEAAVEYLYSMPRFTSKNTLEDTRAQLVRLGSPDRRIKQIIHVAGTNGKGSVCAYLHSILKEAGFRTAVFTSPHLVDIRERFAVDGSMISREDFLRIFLKIYDSLDWTELEQGRGYHPTFFEYLFFMAMLYFAEQEPDYCILETGLGGRLDATNAVAEKALAVITRISKDHVEYLGDTLAGIAAEKAGIMSGTAPLVYCDEVPEASAVFVERAQDLQIRTYPVSKKDYSFLKKANKTIDFSLNTRYY
ncbi:MAG: bifunctional folylpolyglutamate synthase/dihydrofolate synthase, partial [Acetatifactor sp.]|nr:bifunctional folylpolyglutamate synthase/dihydrofolate synthase [Acetatifactor sp.]